MKYLFILTFFLSCKSGPRKIVVAYTDTTTQATIKRDIASIDIHDPYETGKDTIRLNQVMDRIFNLPEVDAVNKQIDKTSKGAHGVSIMVHDEFNRDTSYYHFMVGDNSHEDRNVNIFDFLLNRKSGQIKVYDTISDSIMTLKDWRKTRR